MNASTPVALLEQAAAEPAKASAVDIDAILEGSIVLSSEQRETLHIDEILDAAPKGEKGDAIATITPFALGMTGEMLALLQNTYGGAVFDVKDPAGMKEAKATVSRLTKLKTSLEDAYTEWNTPIQAMTKLAREQRDHATAAMLNRDMPAPLADKGVKPLTIDGDVTFSGSFAMRSDLAMTGGITAAPSIYFMASDAPRAVVTVMPDGRVELGEGVMVDEAARAFWDAASGGALGGLALVSGRDCPGHRNGPRAHDPVVDCRVPHASHSGHGCCRIQHVRAGQEHGRRGQRNRRGVLRCGRPVQVR